ncbi:MAG: iron-containing alcohol dehydrogenase family protein [Clostridia bacterium]
MKNLKKDIPFVFNIPTKVFFGENALKNNADVLKTLGSRAFIVAGANSGRLSGALIEIEEALNRLNIAHAKFEGIGNNPNVSQCKEVGLMAREFGADFIIGIGGGSPLDASKAVAVFAANDIDENRLFTYGYDKGVLPIVAVSTTSGTGSEITPWSVMTVDSLKTKRSFGGELTFPRIAIVDPKYTNGLSKEITLNTAIDAFTHCFESMFSIKASPITNALNLYALELFGECFNELMDGNVDNIRENLSLVSLFGGATISQTGTTLMHAMGYPLTYFYHLPHGAANAVVLPTYLEIMKQYRCDILNTALGAMNITYDELLTQVSFKYSLKNKLNNDEILLFASQTAAQSAAKNSGVPVSAKDFVDYFGRL